MGNVVTLTGFKELDNRLSGLLPGELLILAGRTGVGKTALALNIAAHVSLTQEKAVALFCLETNDNEVLNRIIAADARISLHNLRGHHMTALETECFQKAVARICNAPLYINDASFLPSDVEREVRSLKKKNALGLVVIDYLQLMQHEGDLEGTTRALKRLATEIEAPILALSQLSHTENRPVLSDLCEHGNIDRIADTVLLVHRDDIIEESAFGIAATAIPIELIIAKHPSGSTGSVNYLLLPEQVRVDVSATSV